MTTISTPFVNGVLPNAHNFTWCAISPTKIVLLYIATTDGSPRYFIQFVNFVNGEPVYGKASLIMNQTYTPPANTAAVPRIVDVGNGRLVFCISRFQNSNGFPTQYSFVLVRHADDIAEFAYESEILQVTTVLVASTGVPQLVGGVDNATFHNIALAGSTLSPTFWNIAVNPDDTLTVGADNRAADVNVTSTGTNILNHGVVRKALDGVTWAAHVCKAQTGALYKKTDEPQSVTERYASPTFSTASTTYAYDSFLPVRGDEFLLFNANPPRLYSLQRDVDGAPGKLDLLMKKTLSPWLAPLITQVYDASWIDADGTFLVVGQTASNAEFLAMTTDSATTVVPMTVWIGKYFEAGQSLVLSPDSPIVPGLQVSKRGAEKFIHVIDDKTIALIGGFDPVPGGFAIAPGIVMIKAG